MLNNYRGSYTKRFFDKLIRMIEENISGEDEWAIFQTNLRSYPRKVLTNLKERYPDLTPGDLRLCALLRLRKAPYKSIVFQNCNLEGSRFPGTRLTGCSFEGCNLWGGRFSGVHV